MRLILSNFRCFSSLDISLPDSGTCIIWGNSGIGKSTIFKAINFALYGKEQKVIKNGEKKCKVELHLSIDSIKFEITRTKNPTHFRLKKFSNNEETMLEDESAQSVIDYYFGKHFLLTSYMCQKGVETFFSLSAAEKSAFLQRLSVNDFDVESIRKKVREIHRKRKDLLISKQTEKNILLEQLNAYIPDSSASNLPTIQEPKFKFDTKEKSIDDFIKIEERNKERNKNNLSQHKSQLIALSSRFNTLVETLNARQLIDAVINEKQKMLDQLQLSVNSPVDKKQVDKARSVIQQYTTIKKLITMKNEYQSLKQEYDKLVEDEYNNIQKEIQELRQKIADNTVLLNDDEVKAIKNQINIYNKLFGFIEEIDDEYDRDMNFTDIYKYLEEYKTELEENKNKKISSLADLETLQRDKTKIVQQLDKDISELSVNIKTITDIINKKTSNAYKCPKCTQPFYIDNNKVVELNENHEYLVAQKADLSVSLKVKQETQQKHKEEIVKLAALIKKANSVLTSTNNDIRTIEGFLQEISSIKVTDSLAKLTQKADTIVSAQSVIKLHTEKLDKLEKQSSMKPDVLPAFIAQKRSKLISIKKSYEELSEEVEEDEDELDEEEINALIEDKKKELYRLEQEWQNFSKLSTQIETVKKEIAKKKEELDKLVVGDDTREELSDEIEKLKIGVKQCEEKEEKYQRRFEKIEKYKSDMESYKRTKSIVEKVEAAILEESLLVRGISKTESLLKKINDAESLSLQNVIDNINHDVSEYVQSFFGDNVTINLSSFKETKDKEKKACIDVSIVKDGEPIGIDALSGGEYDRVCLSFFLAFNKVTKSNIIMMDESLSSLHAEMVEDIVMFIKDKLKDKLILFTLHQSNTGIFDEFIDVEKIRS